MIDESILKTEERAVFKLRSLYRRSGYQPYKMSKFEEYDFYAKNKDFLVSDGVITFTDTNGRLLALKPDVTLSIINNYREEPGCLQRVYYNENVYRVSGETHEYKEIMQTGLECMGDVDLCSTIEVLRLAAESLRTVSEEFVLEISHMGILAGILNEAAGGEAFNAAVTTLIDEKNAHEIAAVCRKYGVSDTVRDKLVRFTGIYGERDRVLKDLEPLCTSPEMRDALAELRAISESFDKTAYGNRVRFDFSLVNDLKYYDGIVVQGFIEGIPEVVLSGGQYDRLMRRIGHPSGAIGFAVYLDLLENYRETGRQYDVDVILLYDATADPDALSGVVKQLHEQGYSVSVQKNVPRHLRAKTIMRFNGKGADVIGQND